jgi:hypothetical protein
MKNPIKTKKSSQAIRRVGELLRDVLDAFGWYGIETPAVVEVRADAAVPEALADVAMPEVPADVAITEALADVTMPEVPTDAAMPEGEEQADEENRNEENGVEEDEEEDYEPPQYYFDPTDVQVAVDEAISQIINEELIQEFTDPKDPPELADIFAILFGENSEIKEQIEYFEELISGYEDRAHIDDLREAHRILETVIEKISFKIPKK